MSAHSDNRAEDFVPGLYPLKVGAIAAINRALGIIAHKPQQAPRVKEYAPDSGNRVDGQSGAANAIVAHTPPPQIEIDHSPLTDDEIAYGQRIADDPAVWDAPGIPLETVLAKRESGADLVSPSDRGVVSGVIKGLDDADDDKMEWLGTFVSGGVKVIDPDNYDTPSSSREKRLSRLRKGGDDTSPKADRAGGVNPDDLARKLSKMSPQRRKVWAWLETMNVTHDEPSCYDAAAATGISHQTSNKVLKEYRNTYGLYRG
jgi:hypothetical protein